MSLKHYNKLSSDFEENWFFSENYFPTLSQAILNALSFKDNGCFADLGCGTGNYTKEIVDKSVHKQLKVVGVDFSQNMIDQLVLKNPSYLGICSDLESFVNSTDLKFDTVLLKEVIHHIKDYKSFYSNLYSRLNSSGNILLVTRPEKTQFPFFEKALNYFSENQIAQSEIINDLEAAGFTTNVQKVNIEISISKEQLFKMIKNRFMSTFNNFSDEEIELGIAEVDQKHSNDSIKFIDQLILVSSSK